MQLQHSKKCGALCCGSRFSNSSINSSSSSSSDDDIPELSSPFSNHVHEMVQTRLEQMINDRPISRGISRKNKCIILLAIEHKSCDPRMDFKDSMLEVINAKGMKEPNELRCLLNCYISVNATEHRQVILEAFHEVCSALFSCM